MSHKPSEGREISNATPELMREELDKYFEHVQKHDPKSIEFALMVAGHGEEDGGTHVCSMIGGSPAALAKAIVWLMDKLAKRDPAFTVFFLINFLKRMYESDPDAIGGPDIEAQVKDLLDKLRDATPPDGSIH